MSGDLRLLARAPVSVELWELESDDHLFVFAEKKGYTLRNDLRVDLTEPGDFFPDEEGEENRSWERLNPGVIPAGTRVDSYYFHFDNATYDDSFSLRDYVGCRGQISVSGTITFARPVLGIAMRAGGGKRATLRQSDRELGVPGTDYCEHNARHFPGVNIADGCGSDRFVLSADRRTLKLRNFTDVHHDNYRVILAAQ